MTTSVVVVLSLLLFNIGEYQTLDEKRSKSLTTVLQTLIDKDSKVPPTFDDEIPTEVECQIYVDSFDSINEASMDYTVSLLLHMEWSVPYIKYHYDVPYFEVDAKNREKIWVPDLYFPNEKKASFHNIMMPNKMMRIHKEHKLSYEARLSLTLSCPMDLRSYPFDRQICAIQMESFGFDADKVLLTWRNSTPVDVNTEIILPQFEVVETDYGDCPQTRRRMGNQSCLQAAFHLERNIQYYIVQMYIPSILIVIVSWISFWLTVTSVAGRISLGVLTVLTMTTQSSGVNASLPRVSYTKAIDIWMSTCLLFVFAALIEFAVVNVLSRSQRLNGPRCQKQDTTENGNVYRETFVTLEGEVQVEGKPTHRPGRITGISCAMFLDNMSRLGFPLAFLSFNAFYWMYYLSSGQNKTQSTTRQAEGSLI
ncbi:glycine receptor subunit alpha-2-like [Haliotis rubra]|uniref:glycine receptor subunit alpha-2-like n=1 Tax=Haliotis rubra TaxID=36100 RepID=UPI001EE54F2E|nr:glycine receptor subunit alpha-2-like [Haliotis rubra]